MLETGILQYNCGNANNETAKEVFDSIDPERFPILAIQEPMITERNITHIPKNYRPSRPVRYGMRVLFLIHDKIPLTEWQLKEATDHTERIQMKISDGVVHLINVYNPVGPVTQPRIEKWPELQKILDEIEGESTLIIGDFNSHHPLWGGAGVAREPKAEHLITEMDRRGLESLNERGVITWQRGESATTIDLAFASYDVATSILLYKPRPEWTPMEDHFPIEIQIAGNVLHKKSSNRFAIKKASWDKIVSEVAESEWMDNDPHIAIGNLLETIHTALSNHCPRIRPSDWSRPEWSPVAAELLAGARRARNQYRRTRNPDDAVEWKHMRNALRREMRSNARTRWRKLINTLTEDEGHPDHPHNKGLWKLNKWSRKEIGTQNGQVIIPKLRRTEDDESTDDNDEKAEILATKFFPQSGTADLSDITNEQFERFTISEDVTADEVAEILKELPNQKAPGPDMVPNEALKALRDTIALGLAGTITKLFKQGELPAVLKESITVVLRKEKKKDYSLPSSYRPIALENTIAKVIEKIIANRMITEAETRGLIPWNQMGARKKRSTLSALELLTGSIQTAWQAKKSVVSVLGLDLAGAFDNVSHQRLLWVLRKMGYPEWIIKVVESFLTGRRTRISFSDYESRWFDTATGIPQGSTLSPALFIFFISDLLQQFQEVKDNVLGFGFVDDTTLITWSNSAESNCGRLTIAHDKCTAWAKRFGAKFAPDKYQIIHFTKKRKTTDDLQSTINIQGHDAELVPTLRVLGVWLDPALSWKDHIMRATQKGVKAFESLARVTSSVWGPSVRKSRLLYTAVARPIMTYGSQVWTVSSKGEPIAQARIKALAVTQNKCLRKIMGAYVRTPVAAIERESAVPPIDLFLQSQATQRAATTSDHEVTQEIESALQQVWNAATTPPRRMRGRPRRSRGPRPVSAMATLREQAAEIIEASRTRQLGVQAETDRRRNGNRDQDQQRTMQFRSKHPDIDAIFTAEWEKRWQTYARSTKSRATTWKGEWKQQPLSLYEGLLKHEATALFLLRTEVMGLRAWLARIGVPEVHPACPCGAPKQTLDHILAFCPDLMTQRIDLISKAGSTELRRSILDDKKKVKHAARWLLQTKTLDQFSVAMEVEEEKMEGWMAFQALQDVSD